MAVQFDLSQPTVAKSESIRIARQPDLVYSRGARLGTRSNPRIYQTNYRILGYQTGPMGDLYCGAIVQKGTYDKQVHCDRYRSSSA